MTFQLKLFVRSFVVYFRGKVQLYLHFVQRTLTHVTLVPYENSENIENFLKITEKMSSLYQILQESISTKLDFNTRYE